MQYDYLVVGAGLYGAVFAHEAKKKGKKVLVIDKRSHIAGNVYTEKIEGIYVHRYGAHIFHTNDAKVWDYVTQFATFNRFTNSPVANYKGELYSLPFNMYTFNKMWGVVTPEKAAAKIEEECGVKITPERLKAAIHAVNEKRRALQRLAATRAADPAPISGLDSLLTVQAAFMDDTPRLTGAINDMAAECEQRVEAGEGVAPKGTKRILYTGTPMAVPNWKLFNLIEKAGGVVVGEESCTGSRYYKDLVDESGETVDELLDAIAERYFKINCAVFTPNDQRMKDIVQMAKDLHADGIVDVALQFCTLYEMESFAVEKAVEEAGIPFMHITTDYAGEDAGQLQTRIEAFLETI